MNPAKICMMEYEASIHPTILQLSVGSWLGSLVRPMYHTTRYVSLLDLASSASLNLIPRVTKKEDHSNELG